MRRGPLKRATLSLAALAGLLVLLLGLGEAGLRAAGAGAPGAMQPDADLGWAPRERPVLLAKPAGVRRIAVLGDEAARGLPAFLANCYPRKTEILDFTVAGYGTAQQYVQLQTVVLRYQPDLVVLKYNPADDERNNSFVLEPRKDRPFFFLDAKGGLAIDASFAASRRFQEQSSLRQQLLRRSRLAQALTADEPPAPLAGDPAAWREARRVTVALLAAADSLVRASGARFAVVVEPEDARALCVSQSGHAGRFE